ncbi:histone deacetylase [Calycina marina]|uniref:histone deacetylase n=1 Tax=Calycina marina TaxID=1763456 RepID=A0A9P7ZBV2_9HELO|nr:histone deacetylase [Calycina marina]
MAAYAPIDAPMHNGNTKKTVDYMYDMDIGNFSYAAGHPMKQHRVRLAHSLIQSYGLYNKMKIFSPRKATKEEMAQFHSEDYVEFLAKVTHENSAGLQKDAMKFNVGDDSPVFDGLFQYCAISAGGSLEGAARLGRGKCDIAVNWAGGLHHAKKSEASGFCYVNDIVLSILELLRYHERVVYIDIDVHHGDGVEEAFFTTDRVMTVSFHQYGEFFPGTGELRDIGADKGKNYSVNFPLRHGIDDASYKGIFEPVMTQVMERYKPGAIVLQCGGDSLGRDRLGSLNLSMRGHANCVNFMKTFGIPLLLLGGGGYTMRNVSRTWAYETGVALGMELDSKIPAHEYSEYYSQENYELDVKPRTDLANLNSVEYLEKIKVKIFENLKDTTFAPSTSALDDVLDTLGMDDEDEDMLDDADEDDNPDERITERRSAMRVEVDGELSDSDDGASGSRIRKRGIDRRNEQNFAELTEIDEAMLDSEVDEPEAVPTIENSETDSPSEVPDPVPESSRETSSKANGYKMEGVEEAHGEKAASGSGSVVVKTES